MTNLFRNADDLGEYLFRITDNGGETADRYTVLFSDGDALALSSNPSAPWGGVSLWCEGVDPATLAQWVEDGDAVDLGWHDLPETIRAHILGRLNQGWADFLADMETTRRGIAPYRDAADVNEGIHDSAGKGIYAAPAGLFVRLDDDADDDRGPFKTAREALLATLPDHYGLAGPEYHSTATSGASEAGTPCPDVAAAVAALEARRDAEHEAPAVRTV